ncbi:M16 family metallopeptidase [Desulfovibrio piger]|uniref:Insulinase family protein n=3 Tax=Desulfovibrio TaxID=872 RepID=A0A848CCQ1_9BACT|nr:pitrilysin family protein [Desulfovibrio piger]MCI7373312.1 insulinase family protein [Desulfovibrio piger]MCI7405700.1 insulinase family protein [Desulfovibrio piger]MDD6247932.1 pitrilysin family protein [Desulfovibrio piger]NME51414.1 insulinase family protein [Desulfovibrio piger]
MLRISRHALLILLLGILLLPQLAAAAPQAAPANPSTSGNDTMLVRLKNGLTVHIIRDSRFPLVCTRLFVGTGSANETAEQAGISHVLEHMVFKGTEKRPKGQVARDVESLGGYLNAATSFDKTWFITDMPAKHWKTGMDVVKDMAFHPSLDPAELEAEKNVIVSELKGGDDTPTRRLFEDLQVAGLAHTVYGRPIIGFEKTIRAVTADDLRAYIRTWYQPQNMMLLVAGDIDPKAVLAHAEELFGDLKNDTILPEPAPVQLEGAAGGPRVEVTYGPWNKVYLGIALPAPALGDQRSIDLDVLAYALGGDGTSQFYRKYRYEKQLVDSISVGNMSLNRAGLFYMVAQLDADKVEPFWQEFTRDLAALDAGKITPDVIERARFNYEDGMDRASETLDGLTSWKATVQFELGGPRGEANVRHALAAVDSARLRQAQDLWLRPDQVRVRVLAPEKAKLPDLDAILQHNWPAPAVERQKAAAAAEKVGKREIVDLGQGRTVILQPDRTIPYVSLEILRPGGNALLKPADQGLAQLTAATLTDGCGTRDLDAMERFVAERAASLSASAGVQSFTVSLTGPARFNADYFALLGDLLHKPTFAEKDVRRQADTLKAALVRRQDNPMSFMGSKINGFLFPGGQPYGFDGLGTAENQDRFGPGDVQAFWKQQNAQPWILSVAGDFDREKVLAFARSLPVPTAPAVDVPQPTWGADKRLPLSLPGRQQAHLLLAFHAVPLDHPDAPALMLLESVLSGQSGLLFNKLRDEQGLGYTVTAFYRSLPEAGFMAFYIGTTPRNLDVARQGFSGIIKDIKTDLLPAELLAKGLNRMEGSYYRGRQSLGARADEAASERLLGQPQDFQKRLLEKAAKVTPEQLREVARKYLLVDKMYEVTLLP